MPPLIAAISPDVAASSRVKSPQRPKAALIAALLLAPLPVRAWESTGHRLTTEAACYLLTQDGRYPFRRREAFALAYYSTVPDLVWKREAKQRWPAFAAQSLGSAFDVALTLARDSEGHLAGLLAMDEKLGRRNAAECAAALRPLLRERLVINALTVAALWQRRLAWQHDGYRHTLLPSPPPIRAGDER